MIGLIILNRSLIITYRFLGKYTLKITSLQFWPCCILRGCTWLGKRKKLYFLSLLYQSVRVTHHSSSASGISWKRTIRCRIWLLCLALCARTMDIRSSGTLSVTLSFLNIHLHCGSFLPKTLHILKCSVYEFFRRTTYYRLLLQLC